MKNLWIVRATLGLAFAFHLHAALAQDYPTKLLRIIVPYPAGGSSDVQARIVAQGLSVRFGQPVIVENRPGASAIIGTDFVTKQPADGYTLLLAAPPFVIAPYMHAKVPYELKKDFVCVSLVTRAPMVVAVSSAFPVHSFADLVMKAKAEPGKISYGSVGVGGQGHLVTELLARRLGLEFVHVPYKGSAPALTDLAGGQINMMLTTPLDLRTQRDAGLIRVIATGAPQRSAFLPDVPTIQESGFAGVDLGYWFSAIVVRAGTSPQIINRLSREIAEVTKQPDVRAKLMVQGVELIGSSPVACDEFLYRENATVEEAVRISGVKPE
jgi:tripartite-type tricarboxylate transporter receptor subunit TctC